eukprot:gb/GFBE01038484.1/.p1 GENE.gb/GFBE01038484.1/~~gb/GFBE01038484.1/.p1  ORF type:complete len:252 (+),score=38.92 gb/GFBE01038484.1/:1-756(+)
MMTVLKLLVLMGMFADVGSVDVAKQIVRSERDHGPPGPKEIAVSVNTAGDITGEEHDDEEVNQKEAGKATATWGRRRRSLQERRRRSRRRSLQDGCGNEAQHMDYQYQWRTSNVRHIQPDGSCNMVGNEDGLQYVKFTCAEGVNGCGAESGSESASTDGFDYCQHNFACPCSQIQAPCCFCSCCVPLHPVVPPTCSSVNQMCRGGSVLENTFRFNAPSAGRKSCGGGLACNLNGQQEGGRQGDAPCAVCNP